jgi:Skp family chaperone for outer membrane proteins
MTDAISGDHPSPITPREKKMYEQEYKHGAQLFQKALQQYVKSDNPYQQEEFHQVMDKAMRVLNETAGELNRKALLDQNEKIRKDYAAFNDKPTDSSAFNKLDHDLDQARKSIG